MIRRWIIAGLLTVLPLVVTVWILKGVFGFLVGIYQVPFTWLSHHMGFGEPPVWLLAILSALTTVLLLGVVGALVGNFVGRQLLTWLDDVMLNVPVVKGIYGATKQLINAIQSGQGGQGGGFKEVVLIEWPHAGSHTLGFVARRDCSWAIPGGEDMVAVYIPTAPNPTSGYVVMVASKKVQPVDVTPDQALTWAISGGVVAPMKTSTGTFKFPEKG
ncbi:MAG TPA: DUF502 domain-containing protein [Holophagaceae bacterium]|nr:DUF502 domain-containing protein [Holophagaceae bacterium]